MPSWTFLKRAAAPLGLMRLALANDEFAISDGDSLVVSTYREAGELRTHPFMLEGSSPSDPDYFGAIVPGSFVPGSA